GLHVLPRDALDVLPSRRGHRVAAERGAVGALVRVQEEGLLGAEREGGLPDTGWSVDRDHDRLHPHGLVGLDDPNRHDYSPHEVIARLVRARAAGRVVPGEVPGRRRPFYWPQRVRLSTASAARTMRWSAASAPPGYCPASASPAVSRMYSSVPPREIAAFSASESSRSCAPVIRPSIRPSRGGGTSARSRRPRGRPPCTARARTSSRRAPRSRAGCSRVPPALACAPGLHPIPLGIERVDAALLQQLAD